MSALPTTPLQLIYDHPGKSAGISLYLKRDDLLHPSIQGNKWRKLEPVVKQLQQNKNPGILTFGGPFSNHIYAVAAAGAYFGFKTAAFIRGASAELSNPTLAYAQSCGMTLLPVSKYDYDHAAESAIIQEMTRQYGDYIVLPEGGATAEAIGNCAAIAREIVLQTPDIDADRRFIAIPAGTGTTAAGVIGGLGANGKTLVFPAANGGVSEKSIRSRVLETFGSEQPADFQYSTNYIFGTFAAFHPELVEFVRVFLSETGILLDPIYTSKMMWGIFDMLKHQRFPEGSALVAIHTGGLQGWDGFRQRFGIDIYREEA